MRLLELAVNTLHAEVQKLWDSYWTNFSEAEQLSRTTGASHLTVRREFAECALSRFHQLEQEFLARAVDATTLLFYKVGFMLYGDIGDDISALKYLRCSLRSAPPKELSLTEQLFAITMTVRAYAQNQKELAETLSLIDVRNLSARDLRQLRRAIFDALASQFRDPDASINGLLYAELIRVCGPIIKDDAHPKFSDFLDAFKASYG